MNKNNHAHFSSGNDYIEKHFFLFSSSSWKPVEENIIWISLACGFWWFLTDVATNRFSHSTGSSLSPCNHVCSQKSEASVMQMYFWYCIMIILLAHYGHLYMMCSTFTIPLGSKVTASVYAQWVKEITLEIALKRIKNLDEYKKISKRFFGCLDVNVSWSLCLKRKYKIYC